MEKKHKTCCFIGHRKVPDAEMVQKKLYKEIESLIVCEGVDTFLFGSRSEFDTLCRYVVTALKEKYPHIRRIYVRAAFPCITDYYENYLLESFEETYFPEGVLHAGRAAYVERNCEMIDKADFCLMYYVKDYVPPRRRRSRRDLIDYQPKSGTGLAYDYAQQKKKRILNVAE